MLSSLTAMVLSQFSAPEWIPRIVRRQVLRTATLATRVGSYRLLVLTCCAEEVPVPLPLRTSRWQLFWQLPPAPPSSSQACEEGWVAATTASVELCASIEQHLRLPQSKTCFLDLHFNMAYMCCGKTFNIHGSFLRHTHDSSCHRHQTSSAHQPAASQPQSQHDSTAHVEPSTLLHPGKVRDSGLSLSHSSCKHMDSICYSLLSNSGCGSRGHSVGFRSGRIMSG